jgi:hypothetical protein
LEEEKLQQSSENSNLKAELESKQNDVELYKSLMEEKDNEIALLHKLSMEKDEKHEVIFASIFCIPPRFLGSFGTVPIVLSIIISVANIKNPL